MRPFLRCSVLATYALRCGGSVIAFDMSKDLVHLWLCFATCINDCRVIRPEPSIHTGRALEAVDVSVNDMFAKQIEIQVVLNCL